MWQSHIPPMLLQVFRRPHRVGGLNWSRTWWNYCTQMGSSHVYLTRIHECIYRTSSRSVTHTLQRGVNSNYVRLTLFLFSLLGEAKRWLISEPANSITTWDDLNRKFLIQFFPSTKTGKLRSDILSFLQKVEEIFYQAWDRLESLLLSCPHHHQANEVLVQPLI